MKANIFPACCGAAIFHNFGDYSGRLYIGHWGGIAGGRPREASRKEYKDDIKYFMGFADNPNAPKRNQDDWLLGHISVIYAITNNHQTVTAEILEELGWERIGADVFNVNSDNRIQLWEYRVSRRQQQIL